MYLVDLSLISLIVKILSPPKAAKVYFWRTCVATHKRLEDLSRLY